MSKKKQAGARDEGEHQKQSQLEESEVDTQAQQGRSQREVDTQQERKKLVAELGDLTSQLIVAAERAADRADESALLDSALGELTHASRSLSERSIVAARDVGSVSINPKPRPSVDDCGCSPEQCLTLRAGCCCFEIFISRVRVLEDQGGIGDAADGGLTGKLLELIFNVLADGKGAVYPSLTSHIQISKKQKWVTINKVINKICIPCGRTRTVPVTVEVREVETLGPAAGRPEFGTDYGSLALKCGCPTVPAQVTVALTGGGTGGGEIEVVVDAREVSGP